MKMGRNMVIRVLLSAVICVMVFTLGCRRKVPRLILATTTSVENTGLLDALIPVFEREAKARVDVVACGTGKAIRLAKNGDCDLILVHDPEAEEKFVKEGYGINRKSIMYNDFVIVGPGNDPARIKGMRGIIPALSAIAHKKALFISRGDDSGTHKRERQLWERAGLIPEGEWYQETGQGMGVTLVIASQKQAYSLTDRATYLSCKEKITLDILYEKDRLLYNLYSIILVNSKRYPHVTSKKGIEFINFLISGRGQGIIKEFGREEFGEPLFHPMGE